MRFVRGILALALLAAVVGGAPWLLLRAGRLGELTRFWTDFPGILLAPDEGGSLLLGVLTLLGWLGWAIFTASVLGELIGLLSGRRIRLPGLSRSQAIASALLVSVAAMASAPVATSSALPPSGTHAVPSADHIAGSDSGRSPSGSSGADEQWLRHRVQRGESLWSIAEQHYGDGRQWARLVQANPGIEDPDEIEVGQLIRIPGVVAQPAPPARRDPTPRADPPPQSTQAPRATPGEPAATPEPHRSAGETQPAQLCAVPAALHADPPVPDPAPADTASTDDGPLTPANRIALAVAGISSLTAAALLGRLAVRRQIQLTRRSPGRQLLPPTPPQRHLESALGQAQDPLTLTSLDLALRALGRHYRRTGDRLPALGAILVDDDRISIAVDRIPHTLPIGFHADATHLWLDADGALELNGLGLTDEPSPYPSVVCLGELADQTMVLHDLETIGLLGLSGPEAVVTGVLDSLLLELGCSRWGSGQSVTVIGGDPVLSQAVAEAGVRAAPRLGPILAALEAERARRPDTEQHPRDRRNRSELTDAWRPRVLLIHQPLAAGELERLTALTDAEAVVAVVADPRVPGAELRAAPEPSVLPNGIEFRAQQLTEETRAGLIGLLERSESTHTRAAPWWSPPAEAYADQPDPFANVTPLGPRRADSSTEEPAAMDAHEPTLHPTAARTNGAGHPLVLLMGPVDLVGARGPAPSRAVRQCIEYCAWLLENPNATSTMMANALFVAEGTRRSNMSRLRAWLGDDEAGEPYLPDAYSGRISLHSAVSSDWHRVQILTFGGVDRCAEGNLVQALELVRGAPLADAAPGQWHWAEELRTDMASMVRDIGLVLAGRALERGDLDLARWAANRALVAAPEDERLLCMRVRTEHRANNSAEVERLALRMVRHARRLNIDLDEETVDLLQQVMEGQPRNRGLLA